MLYTPCVEFQSVFITSNYPLKKKANLFSKGEGGRLWQNGNAQTKPCKNPIES